MKLFSCYLEHLDSLGLRYAKQLKSWVCGYRFFRDNAILRLKWSHQGCGRHYLQSYRSLNIAAQLESAICS
jgi:hypothetical protein